MENKILRVVLSAVIAVALWFYVISVVSPESEETFYDIPVSYQNDVLDERGLMIVSDTPTVTLKLKGNRSDLNELNASNITILVNLAAIQAPGTQMVQYDVSYPANLPSNAFETLSQTPNLLLLKVENKVKKPVPIVLDYMETKVPEGYLADKENPVLDVSYVEVSGPESSVSQITSAVVQVDLTEQTDSIVGTYEYVLCNEAGEPVDAQMVTTNVENINLSVKIQRVKEVPLVLVLGTVNLADLQEESNELTFDVVLPEGVTNETGETQVTVTITFPDLTKKKMTITKDQFQAISLPEGAEAGWITEMVEVELRGHKDLIRTITAEDLTVTVDFAGEELGIVSKVPKLTMSTTYASVGAISVSAVTANLQMRDPDATTG